MQTDIHCREVKREEGLNIVGGNASFTVQHNQHLEVCLVNCKESFLIPPTTCLSSSPMKM